MQLTITIDLGNEAMETRADVVDAIRGTFQADWRTVPLAVGDSGHIRDGNGNTVGKWEVQ